MSSTRFEIEGSSAGRRLCINLWYCVFYMHQYIQFCRWKTVFQHTLLPTRVLILVHVKHTIPYMYTQPSVSKRVEDIKIKN